MIKQSTYFNSDLVKVYKLIIVPKYEMKDFISLGKLGYKPINIPAITSKVGLAILRILRSLLSCGIYYIIYNYVFLSDLKKKKLSYYWRAFE